MEKNQSHVLCFGLTSYASCLKNDSSVKYAQSTNNFLQCFNKFKTVLKMPIFGLNIIHSLENSSFGSVLFFP